MQINHRYNLASGIIFAITEKMKLAGMKAVRMGYNWRERQRIEMLLHLDDSRLNDLGISRYDVEQVLALPLSRNPACELERRRGVYRPQ